MTKISRFIAVIVFSASAAGPAKAAESPVLEKAGMTLAGIAVPAPITKKPSPWIALRKITVNEAQPDMENTLVGMIQHGENIDTVAKDLAEAGFKAEAVQDNLGGYMVLVDVTGQDAGDRAIGLARYYYVTQVKVSRRLHAAIFGLDDRRPAAVKLGTITGAMNHSPVDVTLNKLDWTLTGAINHSPVNIRINHEENKLTGGANHSPVDLSFVWSPEEVSYAGGANHGPVKYTVNWNSGLLEGYSNHAPLRLGFNMDEGNADATTVTVTGYANHAPVGLTYDKLTGRMTGFMDRSPADIKLVNCDLYDFLQYFFLFIREQAV